MRYRLVVQYEGTDYAGWQVQARGRTVQGELERALAALTGQRVRVLAAGRTDAGVHASGQVASFALERAWSPQTLARALNATTPADIVVVNADIVPDDFHPRRWALSRTYTYRIWNDRVPNPFWRRYAWHVARPLDVRAMEEAAARVCGQHDFSAFRAAGCEAAHPVRYVMESSLRQQDKMLIYRIEANGFLRHMVRNLMGTFLEVGLGKRSADDISRVLAAGKRNFAGPTAPAHGLCLTAVRYPEPLRRPGAPDG